MVLAGSMPWYFSYHTRLGGEAGLRSLEQGTVKIANMDSMARIHVSISKGLVPLVNSGAEYPGNVHSEQIRVDGHGDHPDTDCFAPSVVAAVAFVAAWFLSFQLA